MMRRSKLVGFAIVLALAGSINGVALAFHRYTNIHGSNCQRSDPTVQQITCNEFGVKVQSATASLSCPAEWSQDSSPTLALQKMVVSLYWFSVPTTSGGTFNPSCTFYLNTTAGGQYGFGNPVVVNPNTSNPIYVFTFDSNAPPLPIGAVTTPVAIGGIASSALYCIGVPQGVGIGGYTLDACYSTSLSSCFP